MANARTEHSKMGMASLALSVVPGALLVVLVTLILLFSATAPPEADETAFGAAVILLVLITLVSEVVALGLGIAGMLQRQRRRLYAFLGIVCSISVLAAVLLQNVIFPA
jgi:hypothetical protein